MKGSCAICGKVLTRASYCVGCKAFVCWTHGEPQGYGRAMQPKIPHEVSDHGRVMPALRRFT
jgi:hypothetical protein